MPGSARACSWSQRRSAGSRPGRPCGWPTLGRMPANLGHLFVYGADLVGLTNGRLRHRRGPACIVGVHAVGALLTVACLLAVLVSLVTGVVRGRSRDGALAQGPELWRLDDMLLGRDGRLGRDLRDPRGAQRPGGPLPCLPLVFAGVVAGRMVARAWPKVPARWAVRTLASAGMAVSLSLGAGRRLRVVPPRPGAAGGRSGHLARGPRSAQRDRWLLVRLHNDRGVERRGHA